MSEDLKLALQSQEIVILHHLLSELVSLLESRRSAKKQGYGEVSVPVPEPEDPALARLFPNAYEADSDAAEFRGLTEESLLEVRLADAFAVQDDLRGAKNSGAKNSVFISANSALSWVRSLATLRLILAARMGIETESDIERLRQSEEFLSNMAVHDWLAMLLETILLRLNNALVE